MSGGGQKFSVRPVQCPSRLATDSFLGIFRAEIRFIARIIVRGVRQQDTAVAPSTGERRVGNVTIYGRRCRGEKLIRPCIQSWSKK